MGIVWNVWLGYCKYLLPVREGKPQSLLNLVLVRLASLSEQSTSWQCTGVLLIGITNLGRVIRPGTSSNNVNGQNAARSSTSLSDPTILTCPDLNPRMAQIIDG